MLCKNPQYLTQTASGKTALVVPRPSIKGLLLDKLGKPSAIDLGSWQCPNTLFGITISDHIKYKRHYLLYELGDGTLLLADKEAISNAENIEHRAGYNPLCLNHKLADLQIVTLDSL